MRVAHLPQRRRVDEADVPFHQRGKGRFCKGRLGLAVANSRTSVMSSRIIINTWPQNGDSDNVFWV
jgi:hypothetical protein